MKIVECPRDAWQGIPGFIPTEVKAAYLNLLLKVGFDTIDFGSFVSPAAMPQVRDTAVLTGLLDLTGTDTRLLAIVANERGAAEASVFGQIACIGFPFSVSETFQLRNTRSTMETSFGRVAAIQELCDRTGKELVLYISMGFGNPYGDSWSPEVVSYWVEKLAALGIRTFSVADTVGLAGAAEVSAVFTQLIPAFPDLEIGGHFHATPLSWREKTEAAYRAGCRRFDGAILGYGGCPMAQDELVGNIATENLVAFARQMGELNCLDPACFREAQACFSEYVLGFAS